MEVEKKDEEKRFLINYDPAGDVVHLSTCPHADSFRPGEWEAVDHIPPGAKRCETCYPAREEVSPDESLTKAPAEKKWYAIHAQAGQENKVKEAIERRVSKEGLQDDISTILVPSEEVAEIKGGKKKISIRKFYPGYVFLEMHLNTDTLHLIKSIPGVTGFIGPGGNPTPLKNEEVEGLLEQARGEQKKPKPKVIFEKGERVRIVEGPFINFEGYVEEVFLDRGKVKLMVEIFERLTALEVELWQVERA